MREATAVPRCTPPTRGGLSDLVVRNAEEAPDSVAFHRRTADGWSPVTARAFRDRMTALARGLIAAGVGAGDRVVLLSSNRYEWTLFDFAIWAAGAVPVPVYPSASAEQIHWTLADSGAVAALVETADHEAAVEGMRDDLPALRRLWRIDDGLVDALVADGAAVPESEVDRRRSGVSPDHPATIIYTSGTTGRPKGCVLSHANFFAEAGNAVELLRPMFERTAGAEACTLLFLPLAHVFGRMVQVGSVQARTPLAHTDLTAVLDDLGSYRPTFILSVPYVLEKVYNGARHKARAAGRGALFDAAAATAISYSEARRPGAVLRLKHAVYDRLVYRRLRAALGGRCRYAISGGAALGERLTHFYRGIGLTVFEGYGLTETTGAIALNSLDAFRPGTVGRPLPGVSIRIADDGEVLARGGPVFSGYWQDEASTRETFTADGWFRTGDLGALDDDGYLSIVGRKKEILVTSGGKNVAPAAIEDRISAHPLVAQTLVVGDGQKYVAALITIDPEHFGHWKAAAGKPAGATPADLARDPDLLAEIQDAVDAGNAAVSAAESVRRFQVLPGEFTVQSGHLTPSLKVRRAAIMADFAGDVAALYDSGYRDQGAGTDGIRSMR